MTTSEIQRAEIPPRESLMRMVPFALRADSGDTDDGDGMTLDGFGAVFNTVTIIDSWEGRFKEKISPGSMKRSFRETPPKIQFDHGRHPLVGSIPIAALRSIAEESDPVLAPEGGAHVIARLHSNWLVEPVREAIASRAVDGMSFRMSIVREVWYDFDGKQIRDEEKLREALRRTWYEDVPDEELLLRDLKELKVPELGPVVWPAYQETSVGVRSKTITVDLGRLGDPQERKTLARAVLLADAAEQKESVDPQRAAEGQPSAGERREPEPEQDAQRATRDDLVGEHPSPSAESRKRRDRIRAATRHFTAYVAGISEE